MCGFLIPPQLPGRGFRINSILGHVYGWDADGIGLQDHLVKPPVFHSTNIRLREDQGFI